MGSVSASLRQVGLASLLATNGEQLAYLNVSVTALVNRNVVKGKDFLHELQEYAADFETLGLTEIEFLKSSITNVPASGETLSDGKYRHRIRFVAQTDISWRLFCTPSLIV